MKNLLTLFVLMALTLTAIDARGSNRPDQGGQNSGQIATITDEQKADLLYIYQEEKVARDVYITLGKLFPNERTFANIQLSEQKHIDAVQNLCVKYNVDISDVNEDVVGVFVLPELQSMYNTLVEQGSHSLLDALYAGELIEVTDIDDLENAMVGMPSDIVKVFSNLRDGSLNHLAAFQNAILRVQ